MSFDVLNQLSSKNLPEALSELTGSLMQVLSKRRTVLPKRLVAPGPTDEQLSVFFEAAAERNG